MNFKKFISAVSVLAIASSMAVVANADYSQNARTGAQTWTFTSSYNDAENFTLNGGATVSSNGIAVSNAYGSNATETGNYVTFVAPADGTIEVTFAGGNNTYVDGVLYTDGEEEGTYTKLYQTGAASRASKQTRSQAVTSGANYYISTVTHSSGSTRTGYIEQVVFTPSDWTYDGVSVKATPVTDKSVDVGDAKNGRATVYTATVENDTEYTLNKVSASTWAWNGSNKQTRGAEATVAEVAPGSSVNVVVYVNGRWDENLPDGVTVTLK